MSKISHLMLLTFLAVVASSSTIQSQESLEVIGSAKITNLASDDSDSVVVAKGDGTLAVRDASTLGGGAGGGGTIINVGQPFMKNAGTVSFCGMTFCSATDQQRASWVAPRAGTIKNLFVYPSNLPVGDDGEVTVIVKVNNVNSALTVIYSVDVHGNNAASNTGSNVAISQGDIITTYFESTGVTMSTGANFQTMFVFE